MRARIGSLLGRSDVWWDSTDPATAAAVRTVVAYVALPFLARLQDDGAMLRQLEADGVADKPYRFDPQSSLLHGRACRAPLIN